MLRSRKKTKKRIVGVGATLLAVAITAGTLYSTSQPVNAARSTLSGVDEIRKNNDNTNPFVILEVVPDKQDAVLGFLVAGEEPVDKTAESIKDMASKEERETRFLNQNATAKMALLGIGGTLGDDGAVTNGAVYYQQYTDYSDREVPEGVTTTLTEIRGIFMPEVNNEGDYTVKTEGEMYFPTVITNDREETDYVNNIDYKKLETINANNLTLYRKHASYHVAKEGETGTDSIILKELDYTGDMPFELDTDIYNNQFFVMSEATLDENNVPVFKEGDVIFEKVETMVNEGGIGDGTGNAGGENGETTEGGGVFAGEIVVVTYESRAVYAGEGSFTPEEGKNYFIVEEADGNDIEEGTNYFYISDTKPTGIFTRTESYIAMERPAAGYVETVVDENPDDGVNPEYDFLYKTFYVFDNSKGYTYDEANGTHKFVADYTQAVYDVASYTGGFTNAEWFKRYVFDLDAADFANMYIDVKTVTYQELVENISKQNGYLEDVDLLYFGGCIHGLNENQESVHSDSPGLNEDDPTSINEAYISATRTLFEVVRGGKPTVMNRSVYQATNNSTLVRAFAAAVMQKDIEGVDAVKYFPDYARDLVLSGWDLRKYLAEELAPEMVEPLKDGENNTSLTYVKENLYVHDDVYYNKTALIPETMPTYVVNKAFGTEKFSDAEVNGREYTIDGENVAFGFEEVIEEIVTENTYLEVAGVPKEQWIKQEVTIAAAIRHIINFGNRRVTTKSTLRVLDLEPADFEKYYILDTIDDTPASDNNNRDGDGGGDGIPDVRQDIHIRGAVAANSITVDKVETDSICITPDGELKETAWLTQYLVPDMDDDAITVEIMGTREFVGNIDDLNETYDLIYLGMDTSIMNTLIEDEDGNVIDWYNEYEDLDEDAILTKTDDTDYNDDNLDHLVYTHLGDSLQVQNGNNVLDGVYRQAGNDITPDKLRDLKEYIEAGYALLLADDFVRLNANGEWEANSFDKEKHGQNDDDDPRKIDASSYMHDLIEDVVLKKDAEGNYLYFGKNVTIKSNIENKTELNEFSRYLGISKLRLEYNEEEGETDDLPLAWDNPYNAQTGQYEPVYLKADAYGIYSLDYKIKLINDAAAGVEESTYNCQLYIDVDADGRYEPTEVLTGLYIEDDDGDVRTLATDGKFHLEADETYTISRDLPEAYTGFVSWKLVFTQNDRVFETEEEEEEDEEENGNAADSNVRCSVSGYSAVPAKPDQKPTINILQITTHNSLVDDEVNDNDNDHLNLDSADMRALYQNVQDFNLNITRISADRFVDKNPGGNGHEPNVAARNGDIFYDNVNESYIDYLNRFDMIVLGFDDEYFFGSGVGVDRLGGNGRVITEADVADAMLAIREYTLSGKSVLFTHDLSSQRVNDNVPLDKKPKGWYANRIIRDLQGMDRYGWMNYKLNDYQYLNPENGNNRIDNLAFTNEASPYYYETIYDDRYLLGYDIEDNAFDAGNVNNENKRVAFTDSIILADNYKEDTNNYQNWLGGNARNASWSYKNNILYSEDVAHTERNDDDARDYQTYVAQVNSGQITEYPYVIEDSFSAAHSHPQYMQLNLETDSRDELPDDVVVWYTLSDAPEDDDNFFRAYEKDVRNNYFIYNRGNVTYTGSGDTLSNDDMEMKLFVNTLVAAYRSGVHAPRATFKENEWASSATIENMYIPYDPNMNADDADTDNDAAFVDNTLTAYFYTTNVDLRQSSDAINSKYYVEVSQDEYNALAEGARLRTGSDTYTYYKEIANPVKMEKMLEVEGSLTAQDVTATSHALDNNTMYSITFTYNDIGLKLNGLNKTYSTDIYVRLGYNELENGEVAVNSMESMSKLHVVCTQLFELH